MSGKKINTNSGLIDSFGRTHNYLRISITEKCNFLCNYCMPENKNCSFSKDILTASEIGQLASAFIELGINKIRLTGGEPLTRNDFSDIAKELGKFNIQKAITTNGFLLNRYYSVLQQNNFDAINISLDTLSRSKFKEITGTDNFEKVYSNLLLAVNKGFEVKVNTVLIRGVNDTEIIDFAKLTRNLPLTIRFIEFMPFRDNRWDYSKIVSHDEILQNLSKQYKIKPIENDAPVNPARYYKLGKNMGTIGIIGTVSKPFCNNCNRIRITADGKIKSCLFGHSELDLIEALRCDQDIKKVINKSLNNKPFQHGDNKFLDLNSSENPEDQNRGMYAIGG